MASATVEQQVSSHLDSNSQMNIKTNRNSHKNKHKKVSLPQQTMLKSHSYSAEAVVHPEKLSKSASYASKDVYSNSNNRDLHSINGKKQKKSKSQTRRRGQTNKFMTAVNVGQTVKLSKDRIAFVRYKGKVKFSVGIWYGTEIYDYFTKTRHNGTVYGKRYFNCPRNKGLFVKREVILTVIKPQNIKTVLRALEQKQIDRKKLEKQREKEKQQKIAIQKRKDIGLTHKNTQNSILALYQKQVYGNNALLLKINNQNTRDDIETKIHKDFKRFKRLSFMASNNPEIISMIRDDAKQAEEEEKNNENEKEEELLQKGVDIDAEAWDSFKERPIMEVLDTNGNDDEELCKLRLFYALNTYCSDIEYVFNKGLFIKQMNHHSKQGRALILECGIQGNNAWYITVINDENIKKYSKAVVDAILDKLLPDIGYDVTVEKQ